VEGMALVMRSKPMEKAMAVGIMVAARRERRAGARKVEKERAKEKERSLMGKDRGRAREAERTGKEARADRRQ